MEAGIEVVFEQTGIIDCDKQGIVWAKEQWQVRVSLRVHPVGTVFPWLFWRATEYTTLEGYRGLRELFRKLDGMIFMNLVHFKFYETKRIRKELDIP